MDRLVTQATGFSIMELMLSLGVAAILASIALPSYQRSIEAQRVSTARSELARMNLLINRARAPNGAPPVQLQNIAGLPTTDPWGQPYVYVPQAIKQDSNGRRLNTEFDLYSLGPDGQSEVQIVHPSSQDDVIVASDGAYIGLARMMAGYGHSAPRVGTH
jgi:general secretion pathway protein G